MSSTVACFVFLPFGLDPHGHSGAFPKIGFLAPPPDNSTSRIEFQSDDVTKMILLKLW